MLILNNYKNHISSALKSFSIVFLCINFSMPVNAKSGVRIKDLSRISGVRDNALIGYGLITGLSGTGDSSRSKSTVQSVDNLLQRFGIRVNQKEISSRNVAAVLVTATLTAYAREGDKLDINVTSVGDARSLLGGTLLLTHLAGPDGKIYALAQGAISIGGFKYDFNGNVVQKNHPTAGTVPNGASVEKSVETNIVNDRGNIQIFLDEPDNTTAQRIANAINKKMGNKKAKALDAGRVEVKLNSSQAENVVRFLSSIENIPVTPDSLSRVVVNERTGTVVSGGFVTISSVNITQGNLKLRIETDFSVSQPLSIGRVANNNISTEVIANSEIFVKESDTTSVTFPENTTVSDLVVALNKVKISSRDIITILLSIKRAGALHAELIIQ